MFLCIFFSLYIGFEFSDCEPSALVQRQGGPCAVIAPVQAYLLKTILSEPSSQNLSTVSVILTFIQLANMNDKVVQMLFCQHLNHLIAIKKLTASSLILFIEVNF